MYTNFMTETVKADVFAMLDKAHVTLAELDFTLTRLREGKINGNAYFNTATGCGCLWGTLAIQRVSPEELTSWVDGLMGARPLLQWYEDGGNLANLPLPDSSRPAEDFVLRIVEGSTPEKSPDAKDLELCLLAYRRERFEGGDTGDAKMDALYAVAKRGAELFNKSEHSKYMTVRAGAVEESAIWFIYELTKYDGEPHPDVVAKAQESINEGEYVEYRDLMVAKTLLDFPDALEETLALKDIDMIKGLFLEGMMNNILHDGTYFDIVTMVNEEL